MNNNNEMMVITLLFGLIAIAILLMLEMMFRKTSTVICAFVIAVVLSVGIIIDYDFHPQSKSISIKQPIADTVKYYTLSDTFTVVVMRKPLKP